MVRDLKVGDPIIWIDEHKEEHPALVTKVWESVGGLPGVNLVYVVKDEPKTDQYGRQIQRQTSVCHLSVQPAGAWAWKWPDE